jgi:hypothetical protein
MGGRHGQFEYDEYEPTAGTLRGEGFEAFIGATAYADAACERVQGEVWLALTGTARFEAAVPATWSAEGLAAFHAQLASVYSTLSGEAVLSDVGNIEIHVKLEHGRDDISGGVQHEMGRASSSTASAPTRRTYLTR